MTEFGLFVDAHPWVTFGMFWVALVFAAALGAGFRSRR